MYTHEKIVNIYIFYQLTGSNTDDNNPTVKNSLFGPVTLTKNVDFDKHQYSGYGIGFDRRGSFLFERWWFGRNVIIFGVDMSSSVYIDNKKRHFNSWKRSNARLRTYIECRKNVFN